MAATLTIKDLLKGFPANLLPKIKGPPTFQHLAEFQALLKENAATITTTLGGGASGYLGLVVTPKIYETITPCMTFNPPNNLGVLPNIPARATNPQIAAI